MNGVKKERVGRVATKNASLLDIKEKKKLGFEHHRPQFPVSDNKGERNSEIREKNFSPCTK